MMRYPMNQTATNQLCDLYGARSLSSSLIIIITACVTQDAHHDLISTNTYRKLTKALSTGVQTTLFELWSCIHHDPYSIVVFSRKQHRLGRVKQGREEEA
jgi:hypothetical protein